MGNFEHAMSKLMEMEGGFANNPDDVGGMTYKGISRKFHPQWPGWERVDLNIKNVPRMSPYGSSRYFAEVKHLNGMLGYNQQLQTQVEQFYFASFWRPNLLDRLQNSTIAAWIFCAVVNAGTHGARWAQVACGTHVDGIIGPLTIDALNMMETTEFVLKARAAALRHRLCVIDAKPEQKQFLKSWLSRDGYSGAEITQILADISSGKELLV